MARNFVAASSDVITLACNANSKIAARSAGSISCRFRTSNAGTTGMMLYSEDVAANALILCYMAINYTVNGRIRVARRDADIHLVDMTWDGSLADGQWHFATYVWRALNDHEVFVDGVSRATSSVNLTGSMAGVDSQLLGAKSTAGVKSLYYDGDHGGVALHVPALSLAEHTALYDRSKHVFNVTSGGEAEVWSYWPLHNTGDDVRDVRNIRLNDTPATVSGTTGVNGIDGAGPDGMTASTDLAGMLVCGNPTTTYIAGGASGTDGDYLIREPSNVLHHPADTTYPYKMYYAGTPTPYASNDPSIYLATAGDPASTWTKQGEVISVATLPMEDPFVVIDPDTGTLHMWAENKTSRTNANGIAHFTSTDGFTWSQESATALDNGAGGAWDDLDVASPIVWVEGTPGSRTWYMLFEGRKSGGQTGQMGLATASGPNGAWTKYGSNPVMVERAGNWDNESVVCDDIVKVGSTYYVTYHALNGVNWGNGVASSTDLHTWTRDTYNQLTGVFQVGTLMRLGGTNFGKIIGIEEASRAFKLFQGFGEAAAQTTEWPELPAGFKPAWASQRSGIIGAGMGR